MIDKVNKEVIGFMFKGDLPTQDAKAIHEAREQKAEKTNYFKR